MDRRLQPVFVALYSDGAWSVAYLLSNIPEPMPSTGTSRSLLVQPAGMPTLARYREKKGLSRRRDRKAEGIVTLDKTCNEAVCFHFFDKFAQERSAGFVFS